MSKVIINIEASFDPEGHRPIPSPLGPFDTREEAEKWMTLNCPRIWGSWNITPLHDPYLRRPLETSSRAGGES